MSIYGLMDICVSIGESGKGHSSKEWRKRSRLNRSDSERREIILASFAPGASIAGVARAYGVNANLLWNWRKKFKLSGQTLPAKLEGVKVDFVPIARAGEEGASRDAARPGIIELSLPGGARIKVDADVDEQALVRVLCALKAAA